MKEIKEQSPEVKKLLEAWLDYEERYGSEEQQIKEQLDAKEKAGAK